MPFTCFMFGRIYSSRCRAGGEWGVRWVSEWSLPCLQHRMWVYVGGIGRSFRRHAPCKWGRWEFQHAHHIWVGEGSGFHASCSMLVGKRASVGHRALYEREKDIVYALYELTKGVPERHTRQTIAWSTRPSSVVGAKKRKRQICQTTNPWLHDHWVRDPGLTTCYNFRTQTVRGGPPVWISFGSAFSQHLAPIELPAFLLKTASLTSVKQARERCCNKLLLRVCKAQMTL